ncbi:MAG: PQQ-binding-like beta-propeller repeat protein [Candidatus Polarisedimenticolia bacterium]
MTRRGDVRQVFAVAFSVAVLASSVTAADWPSFRGDAQLTGVARDPLPDKLSTAWTFQAPGGIESTAAISSGTVFVGSVDGTLQALDLATGKPRWAYAAGQPIKSSPTVAGGLVYVGDEGGTMHAVDAATGKRRWVFQAEASIVSSAALAGGRLIFGSHDNNVYALAAADGSLAWKLSTGSYVYATPAVIEGKEGPSVVVSGCDGLLRVVRVKDGVETMKVDAGGYMGASAAVAGTRAFVGTFENQFVAVDLKQGAVAWRYEHPEKKFPYYASAALAGDLVIVGGRDKMVRALRQANGEPVWTTSLKGRVDASPVVAGSRVVAASVAGELVLLDLASGKTVWEFETGASLAASPSVGGGFLIIGNTAGTLFAFGKA